MTNLKFSSYAFVTVLLLLLLLVFAYYYWVLSVYFTGVDWFYCVNVDMGTWLLMGMLFYPDDVVVKVSTTISCCCCY